MNPGIKKLRKKYVDNPPKGMSSEEIRRMSEDDLLNDEAVVEGFYIF